MVLYRLIITDFECPVLDQTTGRIVEYVTILLFGGIRTFKIPIYETHYNSKGEKLGEYVAHNNLETRIINQDWFQSKFCLCTTTCYNGDPWYTIEGNHWELCGVGLQLREMYLNTKRYIAIYNEHELRHTDSCSASYMFQLIHEHFNEDNHCDSPFKEVVCRNYLGGTYERDINPRILLTRKLIPNITCDVSTLEMSKEIFPKIQRATMEDKVDFMIKLLNKKCASK